MSFRRSLTTNQLNRLAQRLGAYIPLSLTNQILRRQVLVPGVATEVSAATLFCDVSGFSRMASELATDGPRGAEELNRVLLMTFTAMINAIHNAGGVVSHFHGDAMMVYFPDDDGQAAGRALACAQFMQSLLSGGAYSRVSVTRLNGQKSYFELSMKVGVGYGRCYEVIVGDPDQHLEFVLSGAGVNDAVAAEGHASAGDVIGSRTVLARAGITVAADYEPLTLVMPVPFLQSRIHWDAYDSSQLRQLVDLTSSFVPEALLDRLVDDTAYFVAEHRPATSLFLRFEGIDYSSSDAGMKLHTYYNWLWDCIRHYGDANCRLNRILIADKGSVVHIFLGAPVAPDAPDQALRLALALQRDKPSFISKQKIGIAAGQVFACAVGSRTRREYTIVGDTVNLSSRLMDSCPVGSVFVDAATAERAKDTIAFREMPPMQFKGFSEPVIVFEALEEQAKHRRLAARFETPARSLFWRSQQEGASRSCLDRAIDGSEGVMLAITGESAVELTRFIGGVASYWLNHELPLLSSIGQQPLSDLSFGLWRDVWLAYFGLAAEAPVETVAATVVDQIRDVDPSIVGDVALLEPVLGIPLPMSGQSMIGLGVLEKQERLFELLKACLIHRLEQTPLMIILEDIQWSDTPSLTLLHRLAALCLHYPLVIVVSISNDEEMPTKVLQAFKEIQLPSLTATEGVALVQTMLGGMDLPTRLLQHLGLDNGSIVVDPLVLEDNVKRLLDAGVVRVNGHVSLDEDALQQMPMPSDVHGLILSKLDALSIGSRTFLQAASVLGRQFHVPTLTQSIVTSRSESVSAAIEELVSAGLIGQLQGPGTYLFDSDIVHKVVYQSVPYGRRQRWHATVADLLSKRAAENDGRYRNSLAPLIAYHYSQTDLHEKTIHFALAAADEARGSSNHTAIDLLDLAEAHIRLRGESLHIEETLSLYLMRADLLRLTEQYDRSAADASQAIQLSRQHIEQQPALAAQLAHGCNLLGRVRLRLGVPQDTLKLAKYVIEELASQSAPTTVADAQGNMAAALLYKGDLDGGLVYLQMARDIFRVHKDQEGLARIYLMWALEHSAVTSQWTKMRQLLTDAQTVIEKVDQRVFENIVRLHLAQCQLAMGEQDILEARAYLNRAQAISSERDIQWLMTAIYYQQALIERSLNDHSSARVSLERGIEAVRHGGNPDYLPLLWLALARLMDEPSRRNRCLVQCVRAAEKRARALDRQRCLEEAHRLRRR